MPITGHQPTKINARRRKVTQKDAHMVSLFSGESNIEIRCASLNGRIFASIIDDSGVYRSTVIQVDLNTSSSSALSEPDPAFEPIIVITVGTIVVITIKLVAAALGISKGIQLVEVIVAGVTGELAIVSIGSYIASGGLAAVVPKKKAFEWAIDKIPETEAKALLKNVHRDVDSYHRRYRNRRDRSRHTPLHQDPLR